MTTTTWFFPKQEENCWYVCGSKPGQCDWCGGNGYCCSGTKLDSNGDCPSDGVRYIATKTSTEDHLCIAADDG